MGHKMVYQKHALWPSTNDTVLIAIHLGVAGLDFVACLCGHFGSGPLAHGFTTPLESSFIPKYSFISSAYWR